MPFPLALSLTFSFESLAVHSGDAVKPQEAPKPQNPFKLLRRGKALKGPSQDNPSSKGVYRVLRYWGG